MNEWKHSTTLQHLHSSSWRTFLPDFVSRGPNGWGCPPWEVWQQARSWNPDPRSLWCPFRQQSGVGHALHPPPCLESHTLENASRASASAFALSKPPQKSTARAFCFIFLIPAWTKSMPRDLRGCKRQLIRQALCAHAPSPGCGTLAPWVSLHTHSTE